MRVRVLSISPEGKINLSIKRAQEETARPERMNRPYTARATPTRPVAANGPTPERTAADGPSNDQAFEERLKKFMQDSDSRMADKRQYFEHKSRNRRR